MGQGSGLNLKNVVRHLPGGDTSLRRMYASHGVPMKASTDGCGEKLAIAIAQRQWAKASGDPIILPLSSMSEVLGIKTILLWAKCSGIVPPPNTN